MPSAPDWCRAAGACTGRAPRPSRRGGARVAAERDRLGVRDLVDRRHVSCGSSDEQSGSFLSASSSSLVSLGAGGAFGSTTAGGGDHARRAAWSVWRRLDLVGGRGGGSEDGEGDEGGAERGLEHDQHLGLSLPMTRGSNGERAAPAWSSLVFSSEHSCRYDCSSHFGNWALGEVAAQRRVLLEGLVELLRLASSGSPPAARPGSRTSDWNASCSLVCERDDALLVGLDRPPARRST